MASVGQTLRGARGEGMIDGETHMLTNRGQSHCTALLQLDTP
jgi:hypothetical protein